MEKKHVMAFLVCIIAVLSVLSALACVRAFAFNEMFSGYEQALNAYHAHGQSVLLLENVTYYSAGLTRNRTDLRFENVGTAQFTVSSVRWQGLDQMQSYEELVTLAPDEYDMDPGSGVVKPNGTLRITVKWGVSGGNISESEWSPNKSYF